MLQYLATEGLLIGFILLLDFMAKDLHLASYCWQITGILFCQYTLAHDYQFFSVSGS